LARANFFNTGKALPLVPVRLNPRYRLYISCEMYVTIWTCNVQTPTLSG